MKFQNLKYNELIVFQNFLTNIYKYNNLIYIYINKEKRYFSKYKKYICQIYKI